MHSERNETMHKKAVRLYGVSLGPGDPELMTVKALRLLESADVIYYPATPVGTGAATSVALPILHACALPEEKLRAMVVPMSRSRELAARGYREAWEMIAADYREGKTVAVVTVGDAGFYSTVSPILEQAAIADISFSIVAGVPSFLAAGAAAGVPLALQDDRVEVLAMVESISELERSVDKGGTVVVMKLSSLRGELVSWLEKRGIAFLYAEKVGMEGEFITSDIGELRHRTIPYFSLLVCSRHCPLSISNQL